MRSIDESVVSHELERLKRKIRISTLRVLQDFLSSDTHASLAQCAYSREYTREFRGLCEELGLAEDDLRVLTKLYR